MTSRENSIPADTDQFGRCVACAGRKATSKLLPLSMVRPALAEYIRSVHPDADQNGEICLDCLHRIRLEFAMKLAAEESGEMSKLRGELERSLLEHELSTTNIESSFEQRATLGERIADRVANFGGSWRFIGIFGGILLVWMIINTILLQKGFDPYPFILLNLVLSCLAAIQAPVIMMSQNRQETKDRMRGENDYKVNLRAEVEIRHLHDKLDVLIHNQWEKLMEVQALQMEMMEELVRNRDAES